MTYEEYLASPEEMARYDILNGWKVYRLYGEQQLANPTRQHQQVQGNLYLALRLFAQTARAGQVIMSPCDVQVGANPLRVRQPDLLFISNERLNLNPPATNPSPLNPGPELIIEIVSPSDKPGVLTAKLADYFAAGVREAWLVRAENQTVELVRFTNDEIETVAIYSSGETIASLAFPGLTVTVDTVFAE
jgi:Uma2 family endonuclease